MKVLHQVGHNYNWNLASLADDSAGDGLILSPVDMSASIVGNLNSSLLSESFLDPQLYLPHDAKGKLKTYPYFPEVAAPNWISQNYDEVVANSASLCCRAQADLGLGYSVIPIRYQADIGSSYFQELADCMVEPFLEEWETTDKAPLLLTIIVKRLQLLDEQHRNELLNWITSYPDLTGVYLIFEATQEAKQIKDATYLYQCMRLIRSLSESGLETHVGYTNTESALYAAVGATSVAMGAYENVRRFSIKRFVDEIKKGGGGPTPRLYMSNLFQWVAHGYLGAMETLYSDWDDIQDITSYQIALFTPTFQWHFTKPELYKHYFSVYSEQVKEIADAEDPLGFLENSVDLAREKFSALLESGVVLDGDSDGSHLSHWKTAINMYRAT